MLYEEGENTILWNMRACLSYSSLEHYLVVLGVTVVEEAGKGAAYHRSNGVSIHIVAQHLVLIIEVRKRVECEDLADYRVEGTPELTSCAD